MSDKIKKIIRRIAEIFVYYKTNLTKAITIFLCIFILNDWIKTDNSPSWFLAAVIILIVYPVFYLVFSVLMLIPYLIGIVVLRVVKIDDDYDEFYGSYNSYDNDNKYDRYYDNWNNTEQHTYYQSNQQTKNSYKEDYQNNYKNSQQSYDQYHNYYQQQNSRSSQQNNNVSEYEKALKFYGLQMPFTKEELKERRRKLMKKAHPDAGGSTEDAEKVNAYYDILAKYAN